MQIQNAAVTGSFTYNGVDISSITGSTSNITSLNAITASILSTTASLNAASGSAITRLSALEVTSGSNITRISALESASGSAITRLSSIESTTGSLNTASGSAITRLSALEVTSGSNITRIAALEVTSGSNISRLSSLEAQTGSYATTGSNTFVGSQTITGSILGSGSLSINGCIVSTGAIVAQTINVQQVTSSIVYSCGSNVFGTALNNTQTICGNIFSTGSLACFAGTICTPALVINKSNPVLYINAGNNEVSTIGFTQGAVAGYGGFIKTSTGLGDRYMSFGLSAAGTNNDATEIVRLDDSGVACFNNAICAPRAELTSDASCVPLRLINGVITGGSTTGVTALYLGDAGSGVSMLQREKYAANQANLVLYSEYGYNIQSINACMGYNGVAFYTAGTKRLNIDGSGITCFSSVVCASAFQTPGCIAVASTSWIGFNGFDRTHAIGYDATVDGVYVRGQNGLRFITGAVGGTERMRLDASGNLGLGVTPSAWNSNSKALQLPSFVSLSQQNSGALNLMSYAYESSANTFTYGATGVYATRLSMNPNDGVIAFYNSTTGTIGCTISFTQAMTLNACGRLILGNTTDNTFSRLQVAGGAWIGQNAGRGLYFADGASYTSVVGLNQAVNTYNAVELRASGVDGQLFLATSGNVGVGTINPSDKLTVTDASTYTFNIGAASGGAGAVLYTLGSAALTFATCGSSNERMRITSGGLVGMGITSPSEKLHLRDTTTGYVGLRLEGSCGYAGSDWTIYSSALSPNSADDFLGFYNNSTADGATAEYKFRLFKTGVANFTGIVCAPRAFLTNCSTSAVLSIGNQDSTNDAGVRGLAIITDRLRFGVSPVTSTYGAIATNGTNSGITFVTYDNSWSERARIECTGITTFACQICTPVLRASRVISNSTQLFDSDFSLNAGVTRSVVLCGGIYTMGDFHLMVYGNAGTGMSTIRLSTAGYFANSNLLQFCELQRYTFGSMTISGVSNNGTSISFNIGNCSGSNNGTGFWRMISLNGDAENNCIRVFVL